jgi:hypothetical protein
MQYGAKKSKKILKGKQKKGVQKKSKRKDAFSSLFVEIFTSYE